MISMTRKEMARTHLRVLVLGLRVMIDDTVPNDTYPWDYNIYAHWAHTYPINYKKIPVYCEICGKVLQVDDSNTEIRYDKYTGAQYRKGYFLYRCLDWTQRKNPHHTNDRVYADNQNGYQWVITSFSDTKTTNNTGG